MEPMYRVLADDELQGAAAEARGDDGGLDWGEKANTDPFPSFHVCFLDRALSAPGLALPNLLALYPRQCRLLPQTVPVAVRWFDTILVGLSSIARFPLDDPRCAPPLLPSSRPGSTACAPLSFARGLKHSACVCVCVCVCPTTPKLSFPTHGSFMTCAFAPLPSPPLPLPRLCPLHVCCRTDACGDGGCGAHLPHLYRRPAYVEHTRW